MLGRAVIAALMGIMSAAAMLYGLAMVGQHVLSCTLDTAARTFTCESPELATYQWALYGIGLCWAFSIPGYAAYGIAGVKPAWVAQIASIVTVAVSFVILFQGYDVATTVQLGDRSVMVFGAVWLIFPPAVGLVVTGLTLEDDDEIEPYTGLTTYSTSMNSR